MKLPKPSLLPQQMVALRRGFLLVSEAAKLLGISRQRAYTLINKGKLLVKVGRAGLPLMVSAASVDDRICERRGRVARLMRRKHSKDGSIRCEICAPLRCEKAR